MNNNQNTQQSRNLSFYKRNLPDSCIPLDSATGKQIFKEAVQHSYMETYFRQSTQLLTQNEPSFCGLATLCMVLNTLEIDPLRNWKGVWRWYDQEMLDCCKPLKLVKEKGITLPEFLCQARCNGLKGTAINPNDTSKEDFIETVKDSCSSTDRVLVVSYSRKTLGQSGDGHFSPIGGYNEKERMVLVMDVARFKYPVYWVSVDLIWESMFPLDSETQKSRGFVVLQRNENWIQSFCQLDITITGSLKQKLQDIPKQLKSTNGTEIIRLILASIPDEYSRIVYNRSLTKFLQSASELGEYYNGREKLFSELRLNGIHSLVLENLPREHLSEEGITEFFTLFLLSYFKSKYFLSKSLPRDLESFVREANDKLLINEAIKLIHQQMDNCLNCSSDSCSNN